MDVRAWLHGLGLGQYAEAFEANHIDGAMLRGLTADDLRELGVTSLGHRKRLLEAAANLKTDEPEAVAATPERRQVAVLFADLCGFTELSTSVDAEELRRIAGRFLAQADEIVVAHGGTVDKHIGDATMAIFGAPVAHEDDPLRAVAAADDLQRAMSALSSELGRELATHVGIALGDVIAGEVGGELRRDYTVVGEAVNLAARLVGEAGPGETMMSEAVWRAVAGRVRATAMGERSVKGIARPQRFWRLDGLGEGATSARLPFVGREVELAQALAVLATAQPGAHLHLRGEAGIGKSRLLAEVLASASGQGMAPIMAHAVDFGTARRQMPLRVLAEALIERLPGWIEDPAVDARLRAAAHDVVERPMPPELAAPYRAMEDSRRVAARAEAVTELTATVTSTSPLVIAIEDLHWADDTLRAFVRMLARRTATARLVVVTTSRPEGDPVDAAFRRDLAGVSVVVMELGPLQGAAMQALARAAASKVDQAVIATFINRSGGNPLFLEQLALSTAEAQTAELPGSIRGLVQARLDRLARADRAALQAASVYGQRVPPAALRALAGSDSYDPRPLIEAGLLIDDGGMLVFAHALIQEGTYASLLRETARQLHRRAADWLGEGEPDLRAQHLDRAGEPGAADAYRLAAEAQRRSGRLSVALERAERGLQLAVTEAQFVALSLLAGHLLLDLGAPREARDRFVAALAKATSAAERGEAEFGIAAALRITDDLAGAEQALDRALAAAEAAELTALASRCHHMRGNLLFPRGRVDECMAEHRRALALAERAQSPELVARALGGLADAFYAQGRMRSAGTALARCIEAARLSGAGAVEIANRPMAAIAECHLLDLVAVRKSAETAIELARQAQNRRAELIALHGLIIAAVEADEPEAGTSHVERADQIVAELEAWRFASENAIFRAQLEAAMGNRGRAAEVARGAVEHMRQHALSYMGAAILGIGASISDDPAEREAWLIEGEALLGAQTLGHNHLFYRSFAVDACLAAGRPDEARRHAAALARFTAIEPMPYTDLIVQRGALLADAQEGWLTAERRATLAELAARAERTGYHRLAKPMRAILLT
ncbi:MAG: adenylate/guanylate cyclase domain-containing protein [Reyranella sp.]|uniref:AAA family ATPase n=1 Tax=Reyranella sp. TaxID=1929291 RepID=UPI003D0E6119